MTNRQIYREDNRKRPNSWFAIEATIDTIRGSLRFQTSGNATKGVTLIAIGLTADGMREFTKSANAICGEQCQGLFDSLLAETGYGVPKRANQPA